LLKRERTGQGSLIEVSLIQAAVSSLVNQASNWLVAKQLPVQGRDLRIQTLLRTEIIFLPERWQKFLLAVGSDRQFSALVKNALELENN
jgi:crotonobetainyl-CoA:carnitine CoA-transferase CaiB-like acyl-CoA transferase